MMSKHRFISLLFPSEKGSNRSAILLLVARAVFAALLATHGWQKLMSFEEMSATFADPLGVGSELSLTLAIFGELVCSLAVILGLLTRLALLPMIFAMGVAFFVVHGGSIASGGELAFAYLVIFILLLVVGAGRYSLDYLIGRRISRG